MNYVIGVDGGGTKTAFALALTDGSVVDTLELESISYREHGFEAVVSRLSDGIETLLTRHGISHEQLKMLAVGAPGYGENAEGDQKLLQVVTEGFPWVPVYLCNDGVVAYYGALNGQPGINLVAGTGAIAFGEDQKGNLARSGGWSEHFSDEGSCYWLGKMAMGLFCKEADGRAPKSVLYDLLFREFALSEDMQFIEVVERDYLPYRKKVASLQRFLLQAAREGDASARNLYLQAAEELSQMAFGIAGQLSFEGEIPVCVTGGLTHASELVMPRLADLLAQKNMKLVESAHSPVEGAAILAAKALAKG